MKVSTIYNMPYVDTETTYLKQYFHNMVVSKLCDLTDIVLSLNHIYIRKLPLYIMSCLTKELFNVIV